MNIKEYLDILKDLWTPTNASKIRMAINNALEMMGNNLKDNIDRQTDVEEQFQDVIDNTTGKDVISAPEIIAARNGETNLKTRIDKDHQEVTAQLAQIESREDIDSVYAGSFGVVADGVTDNTDSLKNAIEASYGKKLMLPSGIIKLKNVIETNVTDDIIIEGKNTEIEIDMEVFNEDTNYSALNFNNNPFLFKDIVEKVDKNSNKIILSDITNLSVGQGVSIRTNEVYAPREGYNYSYYKGFISIISNIEGNTITLQDNIPHEFNLGHSLKAAIYKPFSVNIQDVKVKMSNLNIRTSLIRLNGIFNSEINTLDLINGTVSHIYLINAYNITFNKITINGNMVYDIDLNYGFYIQNATNVYLTNTNIYTLRHCVSLSGEPPSNVITSESQLRSYKGQSVDSHCSESMTIRNSKLYDGLLLGLGSVYVYGSFIQSSGGQSVVSVRQDASAFLGNVEFYNTNFFHRGTPYPDSFLLAGDLSDAVYINGFYFENCEFEHNYNYATDIIRLNNVGTIKKFGDIELVNCKFKTGLEYFVNANFDHENVVSNELKMGNMTIEGNTFEKEVMIYFRGALRLFKNIYLTENVTTNDELIYINSNGNGPDGELGADVYIFDNKFKKVRLRVLGNTGVTYLKDNLFEVLDQEGGDNVISAPYGNLNVIVSNLFGETPINIENATIGWNRSLNGETPYGILGGNINNLEDPL